MRFYRDHFEWGKYINSVTGETEYAYYFWFMPNWLSKKYRYWGHQIYYYDGPIGHFGFWWFNISWKTQWTKDPEWL